MNALKGLCFAWFLSVAAACTSSSPAGQDAGTTPTSDTPTTTCMVTNFTPSPGLEGCFNCMLERCCAETTACDEDPDCVYCTSTAGQLDTTERCIDQSTFMVMANRRAMNECQVARCTPPCGVPGGSSCTPSNCAASCPGFARGCR